MTTFPPNASARQPKASRHGNLQKHQNPNPLQRWLLSRFHRRVVSLARETGAGTILDAGCGEGFTLSELEKSAPAASLYGMDFSPAAVAWGRDRRVTRACLGAGDVTRLPFADDQFDLVLCLEVLEHLPRSEDGLAELLRVSKGHALVSVPHEPWFRGANFLRGKHLRAWGNDPEHLHNYTGAAFRHMCAAFAGISRFEYSFPWQIALLRK